MEIASIPLAAISVSAFNTRKDLDAGTEDAGIGDLAASIRERGLLGPITVRRQPDGGFELIAGQRRFLACQQLGMASIPAIVRDDLDDTDATVISLVENVHRADMSPLDKAQAYQRIHERYGSYAEVARQAGVSPQTVRKYLHLLRLHPDLRQRLTTAEGPVGIATMSKLAETFSPDDQGPVLDQIDGFKQDIQVEILKSSAGDRERVGELRRMALEGAFDARTCRDGLCFLMPDELKSLIGPLLRDDPGQLERTVRELVGESGPGFS